MIGAFVGGLFDGFKAGQDILEARNKLAINQQLMEGNRLYLERLRNEGSGGTPGVTRESYGGGGDAPETSGSSTPPAEPLPPEATARGGNKRGWGAPTPEMNDLIQKAAAEHKIPAEILTGVLSVESNFNPDAIGPATRHGKAKGIAQFIDSTAKGIGLKDPFDIYQAIPAAAKLLRQNVDRYGGDATNPEIMTKALSAYNAGTNQSVWNNPETRRYVPEVFRRSKQFLPGSENRVALPEVRDSGALPQTTVGAERRGYQQAGTGLRPPTVGLPDFAEGRASALGGDPFEVPAAEPAPAAAPPLGRGQARDVPFAPPANYPGATPAGQAPAGQKGGVVIDGRWYPSTREWNLQRDKQMDDANKRALAGGGAQRIGFFSQLPPVPTGPTRSDTAADEFNWPSGDGRSAPTFNSPAQDIVLRTPEEINRRIGSTDLVMGERLGEQAAGIYARPKLPPRGDVVIPAPSSGLVPAPESALNTRQGTIWPSGTRRTYDDITNQFRSEGLVNERDWGALTRQYDSDELLDEMRNLDHPNFLRRSALGDNRRRRRRRDK